MRLATDGGLRAIDAGQLRRARELEALALLDMEIQGSRGTGFASAIQGDPLISPPEALRPRLHRPAWAVRAPTAWAVRVPTRRGRERPVGSRVFDLLGLVVLCPVLVLCPIRPGVNLDAPRTLCLWLGDPEGEHPVGH